MLDVHLVPLLLRWMIVLPRRHLPFHELLAGREALGRPRARRPRLARRVAVHLIDLLEREVRGFVQEEVHDDSTGEVARGEDEAVSVLDGFDDEGREEREEEVPKPIGCRRECGLASASACREGLADEDPDTTAESCEYTKDEGASAMDLRSPGHSIAQNEQASRNDHY